MSTFVRITLNRPVVYLTLARHDKAHGLTPQNEISVYLYEVFRTMPMLAHLPEARLLNDYKRPGF